MKGNKELGVNCLIRGSRIVFFNRCKLEQLDQ